MIFYRQVIFHAIFLSFTGCSWAVQGAAQPGQCVTAGPGGHLRSLVWNAGLFTGEGTAGYLCKQVWGSTLEEALLVQFQAQILCKVFKVLPISVSSILLCSCSPVNSNPFNFTLFCNFESSFCFPFFFLKALKIEIIQIYSIKIYRIEILKTLEFHSFSKYFGCLPIWKSFFDLMKAYLC